MTDKLPWPAKTIVIATWSDEREQVVPNPLYTERLEVEYADVLKKLRDIVNDAQELP